MIRKEPEAIGVAWYYLPLTGLFCLCLGFIVTTMTQDIWSAHTSYACRNDLSDFAQSHQVVLNQIHQDLQVLHGIPEKNQAQFVTFHQSLDQRFTLLADQVEEAITAVAPHSGWERSVERRLRELTEMESHSTNED